MPTDSRRPIDPARLAALRAAAQLLHRPTGLRHPADVARAICGAQAQDQRAGRLAFRARNARLLAANVDRARTEERSLLRTWAMRSTMHLLATDDAAWLLPLFEPVVATNSRRRLGQLGMDAGTQERALREIARALEADGPLPRRELTDRLQRKGIALDPSTSLHIFRLAVASGIACLGPDDGAQTCLAGARDWLGERPRHDRDAALVELARRYLRAFGPATEADFAGWSGLGLRDVRLGLAGVGDELNELRIGGGAAWTLKGIARRPRGPVVRLLPAWDTYLMGYRDRGFLAEGARWRRIMPGGGILRPTIVLDGVAVGTWRSRRAGRGIRVEPDPFAPLDAATAEAIEAEVADVGRFEGVPVALEDERRLPEPTS
jgi:Winged helix DNA-binding domain